MICLSSTTVVLSADLVVVGCWCRLWFPNSWFLHALCFWYSSNWLPLFYSNCLLFSQSQLPRLHPGLCVSSSNARLEKEYRSIGYNWFNTSLLLISEELMQQDTADHLERQATVPILMLTSYRAVVLKPLHEVPPALHILYVSLYLTHTLQVLQSALMSGIRCDRWGRHTKCAGLGVLQERFEKHWDKGWNPKIADLLSW